MGTERDASGRAHAKEGKWRFTHLAAFWIRPRLLHAAGISLLPLALT